MPKPKKSLSSMDYTALVREFQSLIGAYIRKAYQPEREVVVLRLNTRDGRKDLVIRTGKAIYLSDKGPENPPQPTGFAMMLRKYLANGRITSIEQQEFDRIIRIGVQKEEGYELIIEGFGDGNIILVKNGRIIQPLISRAWRHRTIRAREDYEIPPSLANPMKMTMEEFNGILRSSERDVVRTLAMDVNLGGSYAEELCLRCGIEKERMCSSITSEEMAKLFRMAKEIFEGLNTLQPGIVIEDETPKDVLPFPLKIYNNTTFTPMDTFNQAVEEHFTRLAERGERRVNPAILKIKRTIEQQKSTILELEKAAVENRERAERLFLRYQEFEEVLKEIIEYGEKHGWSEMAIALHNRPNVKEVNPAEKYIVLKDKPTDIRLDYMRSINENAQRYYERASRAKEKLAGAQQALKESMKRLEKAKKQEIKEKERLGTERKHFWFEKYRWFISSEGNIVVGGKDARTNERVVKKYLKERDRYAHAEIHGAPSLVVKAQNNLEIGKKTLDEACTYAACFSRAWKAGIGGVEAYWVKPDQVSRTPATGEFLAKGAFIIRGKRNRINAPLKLAIGGILYKGVEMVMCAPISAVEAYTNSYLIIEPGEMPKDSFATKLSRHYKVPNEEILSILPGNVMVTGKKGMIWTDE